MKGELGWVSGTVRIEALVLTDGSSKQSRIIVVCQQGINRVRRRVDPLIGPIIN